MLAELLVRLPIIESYVRKDANLEGTLENIRILCSSIFWKHKKEAPKLILVNVKAQSSNVKKSSSEKGTG